MQYHRNVGFVNTNTGADTEAGKRGIMVADNQVLSFVALVISRKAISHRHFQSDNRPSTSS